MARCVYRCRDKDGRLLYVGSSRNLATRLTVWSNTDWWTDVTTIEVAHYPTNTEGYAAERDAISTESPLYNVQGLMPRSPRGTL